MKLQREQSLRLAAQRRVAELEERLRVNATNSSLPPSANPRGAPKPAGKRPTGRRRGAQVGHKGHGRRLIPIDKVDETVQHRPAACVRCHASLDGIIGAVVGRHQVAELPPVAVRITEHQSLACRCGRCGAISRGTIPDAVRQSVVGPRLSGAIGLLSAFVHGSRRAIRDVVAQVLGCPIALGSISARERELSDALEGPYGELVDRVQGGTVKFVDETGWKQKGKDQWLFVAATPDTAVFRIERTRTRESLNRLLRDKLTGAFCSDRAGIYDLIPLRRRGLCWAHLKRDFLRCMERGGDSEAIGQEGIEVCREVFTLWRAFRRKKLTRAQLEKQVEPLRRRTRAMLERGAALGIRKTSGFCRALLKREAAMWNWTRVPGLEPTNNLAERMLRPAVIWRKKSFGSDSVAGSVFAERMLSVIQTLRLRTQNVLPFLVTALTAHREEQDAPTLAAAA